MLKISCVGGLPDATDLGYILSKNPATGRQTRPFTGGEAHIYFSEATSEVCSVVLDVVLDSLGAVRNEGHTVSDHVNDRPYTENSYTVAAIREMFASALNGQFKAPEHLPADLHIRPVDLSVSLSVVPCRYKPGATIIQQLFGPVGYKVDCTRLPLDSNLDGLGDSDYYQVTLAGKQTVRDLLRHLSVFLPVLDKSKHYAPKKDEVEKLLRLGDEWLPRHPMRALIVDRYLRVPGNPNRQLIAAANKRLDEMAGKGPRQAPVEEAQAKGPGLHQQRFDQVIGLLKGLGAETILDLGCGEAKLLVQLAQEEAFRQIVGIEVSTHTHERAERTLGWKLSQAERQKVCVQQGSLLYRDPRMLEVGGKPFDAAVCVEVVEHIDPWRLPEFEKVLFRWARPPYLVLTTPNVEYNPRYNLKPGQLRHRDHRFEWTRAEFRAWVEAVAERNGYTVLLSGIGEEDPEVGTPTQMAAFARLVDGDIEEVRAGASELPSIEGLLQPGKFIIETALLGAVPVNKGKAFQALEELSTRSVNPRWLLYLPPTMSPGDTSQLPGFLEHPHEVFEHFQRHGVSQVVCEEKHMGSRAVVIACRNEEVARRRFGVEGEGCGVVYTRNGRPFFGNDTVLQAEFIAKVNDALSKSDFWGRHHTDWVALDCELMPWSAKAQGLIKDQYAAVGTAALASLSASLTNMEAAHEQGVSGLSELIALERLRLDAAERFGEAYRRYCWPVRSLDDYRLAPFHILAMEGTVPFHYDHRQHMEEIARVAQSSDGLIIATRCHYVDLGDAEERAEATRWWEQHTASGGEGMVVKPLSFIAHDDKGLLQPAIKCRGPEYLRIIYGPDYLLEHNLTRLRRRGLSFKRKLALQEFALGHEGLMRFVNNESLARVHECAFGVCSLESEVVDPRL